MRMQCGDGSKKFHTGSHATEFAASAVSERSAKDWRVALSPTGSPRMASTRCLQYFSQAGDIRGTQSRAVDHTKKIKINGHLVAALASETNKSCRDVVIWDWNSGTLQTVSS